MDYLSLFLSELRELVYKIQLLEMAVSIHYTVKCSTSQQAVTTTASATVAETVSQSTLEKANVQRPQL